MNPILYRYKDTESVIKVMDGYTPGDGWSPLYGSDEVKAATAAALERAAEVCDRAEVFAWEQWKATGNQHTEGVSDGAASLARDIRALKDETE